MEGPVPVVVSHETIPTRLFRTSAKYLLGLDVMQPLVIVVNMRMVELECRGEEQKVHLALNMVGAGNKCE